MPKIDQGTVLDAELPLPSISEQSRIVADVGRQLSMVQSLTVGIEDALIRSAHLRRAILEYAFAGQAAPQDPTDEPASDLVTRIATERSLTSLTHRRSKQA
jgi:type I restriction enzyme S subunit